MKVARLRPTQSTCMACLDMQIDHHQVEDCSNCKSIEYEILSTGSGLFQQPWAIIVVDGKAQKVPLTRLCDIREV